MESTLLCVYIYNQLITGSCVWVLPYGLALQNYI